MSVTLTRPWQELWLRGWGARHQEFLKIVANIIKCGLVSGQWMSRSALWNPILNECWQNTLNQRLMLWLRRFLYCLIHDCCAFMLFLLTIFLLFSFVNSHIFTITVRKSVFIHLSSGGPWSTSKTMLWWLIITTVPCHTVNSQGYHDQFSVQNLASIRKSRRFVRAITIH